MSDIAGAPAAAADPSPNGTGWFTDTGELDKLLRDGRAADKVCKSSFDDAEAVVDAFAQRTRPGAWSPNVQRADVAQRLAQLMTIPASKLGQPTTGPRTLNQGGLNVCGPTTFFQMALGRDPAAVMRFATDLFDNGTATLGGLVATPHPDLSRADFGLVRHPAAHRPSQGVGPEPGEALERDSRRVAASAQEPPR